MSTRPVRVLLVGEDPAIEDLVCELRGRDDLYVFQRPALDHEGWPDIVFGTDGAADPGCPVLVDVTGWSRDAIARRVDEHIAAVRDDVEQRPVRSSEIPSYPVVMRAGRRVVQFDTGKVVFTEVEDKTLTIYLTDDDPIEVRWPLYKFKPLVPPEQFPQISKSVIVNKSWIREIREVDHELVLKGGKGVLGVQRWGELKRLKLC